MQQILCIDLTSNPSNHDEDSTAGGTAAIVAVEGRVAKLIETLKVPEAIRNRAASEAVSDGSSTTSTGAPLPQAESELGKLLSKFGTTWTSAVLVINPEHYVSLNVDLPFSDPKQIGKVLPLEIQDRSPFDLNEYLVEHRLLGPKATNGVTNGHVDVHVGLVPRKTIRDLVGQCKGTSFEPLVITTPAAVMGALLYVAPNKFSANCSIILPRPPYYFITLISDGVVRADRIISTRPQAPGEDPQHYWKEVMQELTSAIKGTLSGFERRYGLTLEKIYIVGGDEEASDLSKLVNRKTEALSIQDVISEAGGVSGTSGTGIAQLAALFVQDNTPPPLLTNFRVDEFAYSPKLGEVLRALKKVTPYLLAGLILVLSAMGIVYWSRNKYLTTVKESLASKVKSALSDVEVPEGLEIEALRIELNKIRTELQDLGSFSQLSPLDTLVQITRDFPQISGQEIRSITIKNNRVKIDGTVKDYSGIDNLDKGIKNMKGPYERRKFTPGDSSKPGEYPFVVEIFISE